MKILWITNILFPEAIAKIQHCSCELKGSGGWLVSSAKELLRKEGIELVVASVSPLVHKVVCIQGEQIRYYALPCKDERKYYKKFEKEWKDICNCEHPDLVHVHGTEFSHGLAFLNANTGIRSIVSIQGVVSAIGQYYLSGLGFFDIVLNTTLFDLFYAGTLFRQRARYIKNGNSIEKPMLCKADYVIGRTAFDEAWVRWLNPEVKYFKCNETLRPEFYTGRWSYDKCVKHSIFISQANYPIKGLHLFLEAMPYLIAQYPDLKVRIAGPNVIEHTSLKSKLVVSTYSKIIKRTIAKLKLSDYIEFLGSLDAMQMKQEYLRTNLFLCPSVVENSPNSLAEALLLGVPCVGSYVGGIPDFLNGDYGAVMYRFDDIPSLCKSVFCTFECHCFDMDIFVSEARVRHNGTVNCENLMNIYKSII